MDEASLLRGLLAFVWAPALVLAGLLDWALHRHQRIELTAGWRESLLHLLMLALVGGAIVAALLLETTAGLLAVLTAVAVAHEACYLADLRVALARRTIPLLEQWVHGFQHLLPWAGLAGLAALAPGQALALLGGSGAVADWSLRWADAPPSRPYIAALMATALALNIGPFLQEAWRSRRAWQRGDGR